MPPRRGALIVFEGLDRAGKSSQCARLYQTLKERNHNVEALRFPDRSTPIGRSIDSYLKGESNQNDHVIHLLFSANRWEAAARIEKLIYEGTTVLIDRYVYSGCVYSAAKYNPKLSLEWARKPDEGLPRPDACIFLDISEADQARRGGFGEERYEKKEMQDRVRGLFKGLRTSNDKDDFVVIDSGRSFEEVAKDVLRETLATIEEINQNSGKLRAIGPL